MTKGEAKVLETDVVIFPMTNNQENQDSILAEAAAKKNLVEQESVKVDIKIRFARLKKSLRKRSASIL